MIDARLVSKDVPNANQLSLRLNHAVTSTKKGGLNHRLFSFRRPRLSQRLICFSLALIAALIEGVGWPGSKWLNLLVAGSVHELMQQSQQQNQHL